MTIESSQSRNRRVVIMSALSAFLVGAAVGVGLTRAEMVDDFRRHPCTYICDQGICPSCDGGDPPGVTMAPVQVRPFPAATPADLP